MINMLIIISLTAALFLTSMISNFIYIIIVKTMKLRCIASLQDVFTLLAYHYDQGRQSRGIGAVATPPDFENISLKN